MVIDIPSMDSYTDLLQVLLTHLHKIVHLRRGFASRVTYAGNRPINPLSLPNRRVKSEPSIGTPTFLSIRALPCLDASAPDVIPGVSAAPWPPPPVPPPRRHPRRHRRPGRRRWWRSETRPRRRTQWGWERSWSAGPWSGPWWWAAARWWARASGPWSGAGPGRWGRRWAGGGAVVAVAAVTDGATVLVTAGAGGAEPPERDRTSAMATAAMTTTAATAAISRAPAAAAADLAGHKDPRTRKYRGVGTDPGASAAPARTAGCTATEASERPPYGTGSPRPPRRQRRPAWATPAPAIPGPVMPGGAARSDRVAPTSMSCWLVAHWATSPALAGRAAGSLAISAPIRATTPGAPRPAAAAAAGPGAPPRSPAVSR